MISGGAVERAASECGIFDDAAMCSIVPCLIILQMQLLQLVGGVILRLDRFRLARLRMLCSGITAGATATLLVKHISEELLDVVAMLSINDASLTSEKGFTVVLDLCIIESEVVRGNTA